MQLLLFFFVITRYLLLSGSVIMRSGEDNQDPTESWMFEDASKVLLLGSKSSEKLIPQTVKPRYTATIT
jgi:hypothetical protein